MSPLWDRTQAKDAGFAQVRDAIQAIEGNVDSLTYDMWPSGFGDDGKPKPPKEFLEVKLSNVHVLEASEELSMDVEGKEFSFRVNCSESRGTFWVEDFLKSADDLKIVMPEGLKGKRVIFKKATRIAKNPKFTVSNFIIAGVGNVTKTSAPAGGTTTPAPAAPTADPMDIALELAIGKTEAQFRTAISLDPRLAGNSILSLAKAGAVTSALVKEGKLVEVKQGAKTIYAKP